ncbi:MAG: hypothetical protein RL625_883, partial [Gemmatimonadota bacterium]
MLTHRRSRTLLALVFLVPVLGAQPAPQRAAPV